MSVFSLITIAALVFIAGTVLRLNRTGPRTAVPAALSVRTANLPADTVLTKPSLTKPAGPVLTDQATGVSYALLGHPWHGGCPSSLSTTEFRWTGGEAAVAGRLPDGAKWYANACSGPLPRQFSGQSQAQAAWSVTDAIEPVYYGALSHSVTVVRSAAVQAGNRPGWLAEFLVSYSGTPHLRWSSELAAVVVTGNAVFYVSVPDNLGTGTVATLLSSLRSR
jgi:hypothetical protein